MLLFISLFLARLAVILSTLHESPFYHAIKTCGRDLLVPQERLHQYQILIFPDDPETHCFVRCILHGIRAWHDRSGIHHSNLQQYFTPEDHPLDAYNRVQSCLRAIANEDDRCSQAYWSLNCYKRQYGNYFFSRYQFVPSTEIELSQVMFDCADKLDVPRSVIAEYHQQNLGGINGSHPISRRYPCFVRCVTLAIDVYDDDAGLLWEHLYVQFGGNEQREQYMERVHRLVGESRLSTHVDRCAAAAQVVDPFLSEALQIARSRYTSRVQLEIDLRQI